MTKEITVVSPMNIALVKYWGKRDACNMLPLNDSISINIDSVYAKTKVTITDQIDQDVVAVNGETLPLEKHPRFAQCFGRVRNLVGDKLKKSEFFRIDSETNFPTSAGLASSAAGFSALVFGIGKLLDIDIDTISALARAGSGSACRSVYGGFVHWIAGQSADGSDCSCRQLTPGDHWSDLRAIVVVVSSGAKRNGSTNGMQMTVETSALLQHRIAHVVPERVKRLTKAIAEKDFPVLAEIAMRDSNQLHAVCLDTYPPLVYLSDASHQLIELVHAFNRRSPVVKVAYTFDAGPNCCLLMKDSTVAEFLPYLCYYFPNRQEHKFIRGPTAPVVDRSVLSHCNIDGLTPMPEAVQYVIVSKLGGAPHVVE